MEFEAAIRLASRSCPGGLARFYDGEEIGPRMLARIAKRTGLRQDGL